MAALNFSQFPQPESNDKNSVEEALGAIRVAQDERSAREAYDKFLWSVGNSHAGTFYPVVLAALPHLEMILGDGGAWARWAVVESLIDLCGSFIPQPDHDFYLSASVQETLQAFVHSMRPKVLLLTQEVSPLSKSAFELLELIDDQAA